jgi:hypothetical protein
MRATESLAHSGPTNPAQPWEILKGPDGYVQESVYIGRWKDGTFYTLAIFPNAKQSAVAVVIERVLDHLNGDFRDRGLLGG